MDLNILKTLLAQAVGITLLADTQARAPLAAVPDGVTLQSLEAFMPAPTRTSGETVLCRYDDFVTYVNDFKQPGARIFVAPELAFTKGGVLARAYLDFPRPGTPAWSSHSALLKVEPSLEYRLLTKLVDDGLMDQGVFAQRLRDVARFCSTLSGADLLEIVQTLTLSSKGEFASLEDDFTGSVRFGYDVQVKATSEATARRNIEVPRELGFHLPVLLGGDQVDMVAELIYRVPASKDGKVQMGLRMPDRKFVEQAVLDQTAADLGNATGVVVAVGSTDVPDAGFA